jgi:hypothetical protein
MIRKATLSLCVLAVFCLGVSAFTRTANACGNAGGPSGCKASESAPVAEPGVLDRFAGWLAGLFGG